MPEPTTGKRGPDKGPRKSNGLTERVRWYLSREAWDHAAAHGKGKYIDDLVRQDMRGQQARDERAAKKAEEAGKDEGGTS